MNIPRAALCASRALLLGVIALRLPLLPADTKLISSEITEIPVNADADVVPVWSNGALVTVSGSRSAAPVIKAYDRTGKMVANVNVTIPGAAVTNIYSGGFARGHDGSLALCGSAYSNDSRGATFVMSISPDGRQQTVIRGGEFKPQRVTVAGDGTIWVAGRELRAGMETDPAHHILRRFDREGRLLGSWLPRSKLVLSGGVPHPVTESYLVASRERVGFYSPWARRYFEFSTQGSLIAEVPTPALDDTRSSQGIALCEDGSVFLRVNTIGVQPIRTEVLRLDRASGTWTNVEDRSPGGSIYGCDGTTLAIRRGSSVMWLRPEK